MNLSYFNQLLMENQENGEQGRRYVVRIDNLKEYKLDMRLLRIFLFENFKSLVYYYCAYGKSDKEDDVVFIYLEFNNAIRELTIRNRLPRCRSTRVYGTREEIVKQMDSICEEAGYVECDYCEKEFNR